MLRVQSREMHSNRFMMLAGELDGLARELRLRHQLETHRAMLLDQQRRARAPLEEQTVELAHRCAPEATLYGFERKQGNVQR